MKSIILLLFFVASSFASIEISDETLQEYWTQFKLLYNKQYSTDEEELQRQQIFFLNLDEIINHNIEYDLGLQSYRMAINNFTDLSKEDFANIYLRLQTPQQTSTYIFQSSDASSLSALPNYIDWRNQGLVTPVQDQGYCGSCYAFSAVASLEGQNKKKTGQLVKLSEQQIMDCSTAEGNNGCQGGLMDFSFQYIRNNGGIDSADCYPYVAYQQNCSFIPSCVKATVTGYVDVQSKSETALQQATATIGPISVAIDASNFQSYTGGIFDDSKCGTDFPYLNHGVTVVGYGSQNGVAYWLVKNSWGISWGENGYIKMSRNKQNQCGIATAASYPLV